MATAAQRHQVILDAALDLVVECGFEGVSMDAVAARARASKATIYRHWSGKAELVAEAMRCRACVDAPVPETGSLRGDLLAVVTMMAEAIMGSDGRLMIGMLAASEQDPELAALLREQLHDAKRPLWEAIARQAAGRGEVADAARAAALMAEVLPALAFQHRAVLGQPLDTGWRHHVVDDVVLPLLGAGQPVAAGQSDA